jgi:3-hydroxybutyryl-CoA dehydrogenase
MSLDPNRHDLTVAVVGTGSMGRGIMQVAAQGGLRVIAFDTAHPAAMKAKDFIAGMLARSVEKGSLSRADADAALARITIASDLDELAKAHVVVEAVVERLDVKQELFAKLEAITAPDTILASNTSSLPITAIAAKCERPERVAGLHFFNPVPLMKLVEVVPGLKTAMPVTEALMVVARRMTREPVLCTDSPGFIVNHVGRAYGPECARILSEGIASHDEIDRIMTGAPGFRMGAFTLQDLVGADVSVAVMESLLGQFYGEPMYAPQPIQRLRVEGGLYGQKSGAGWYVYKDGKKQEPAPRPAPKAMPRSVWVYPSKQHPDLQAPFLELFAKAGASIERGERPGDKALIVVMPIGYDITTAATELSLDPARTVGVDVLFGTEGPRTLMVTPATSARMRDAAHALLAVDGQPVVVINDSPGFVAQRIVAHIVNVSCQIAQRAIASPADIDKGAKLGLGYPFGPLEWGDRIGAGNVLFILERLQAFYREPRYRPSPWLRRRAALGLSLLAPEGRDRA